MTDSGRRKILSLLEREFHPYQKEKVLSQLELVKSDSDAGLLRIQKAVVKLSLGNPNEVPTFVEQANLDSRDIIAWAEYPLQMRDSAEELGQYFPNIGVLYSRIDKQQYENWENRTVSSKAILDLLMVGIDTTMRGKGISLKQAIEQSNFEEIRKSIRISDIQELAIVKPEFIEAWLMYSEDKRTSGGFAFLRKPKPKVESNLSQVIDCIQLAEDLGKYILKEIEFWYGLRV